MFFNNPKKAKILVEFRKLAIKFSPWYYPMAMGITGRLLFKLIIVIRMRFNMYNHVPEREAGT